MSIDQVSFQIGVLQTSVENLAKAVAGNTKTTEETKRAVRAITVDVASIKKDVGEMKPVVARVTKYEQRSAGIALIFTLFGGAATFLGWPAIKAWFA